MVLWQNCKYRDGVGNLVLVLYKEDALVIPPNFVDVCACLCVSDWSKVHFGRQVQKENGAGNGRNGYGMWVGLCINLTNSSKCHSHKTFTDKKGK